VNRGHLKQERIAILDRVIGDYVGKGYKVISRYDFNAQLIRPKHFNFLWALLSSLVFGVGLVVYVVHYKAEQIVQVYLEVDERGVVRSNWDMFVDGALNVSDEVTNPLKP
jgi:hypothetical protein